jgi:hypothetical protein
MATLVKKKKSVEKPVKAKRPDYHERVIVQPMERLAALLESMTRKNGTKPT